ncbi:WXG100 family type VII secretion target [Actinosynnema sp. CS-041913]|uniref:WXG100 family type VII secretion target n=1 Tax=Actinosynnema sp. CS-041913 TaxID=3239917 RepID=UPI003D909A47
MGNPSWNDVQKVLDDPNVSEDKKADLMHAYVSATPPWDIPDGADAYKERYDTSSFWNWGDHAGRGDNLQDRLDEAKAESDTKGYNSREQTKAVDEGQKTLDGKQPPTASGSGTKLSDELFDAGKAGLKVFEKFLPIWNNRPGDCLGNTSNLDFANHIQKPYDEQRGINFHKLLMEADEFSTAKSKIDEMKSDVDAKLKTLYGEWEGKAATKSYEHYTDQIVPKITELGDGLNGAADLTRTAVSGVYQLCKGKADEVLEMYRERIAKADTYMAEKVVSFARGEGEFSKDRVREIAGWVDSVVEGSNIAERLNDDDCKLNDENKEYAINQCKRWIQQSFNVEFWGLYEQFKSCCSDTKTSVDAKWETLASYMAEFENPFPAPADDKGGDKEGNGNGNGNGNGSGNGTGGGGGSGTGGGGSGSGGGGGGTPPPVPEIPKPENPLDKDGDGKPDDVKIPGDTDGDGKPDDLDGDGKPDDLDGDGKPDDQDGDGKPDGVKGEEEPETVTIKSGDNEIKITEPDENGHVQITVDTPTTEPKTYDVDFSNNPDALKALTGQNGGAALATALAGATSATPGTPGAAPAAPTTPGAAISGGGGAEGAIPIEAGADGKALIEADGLSITAEVDPLTGEINLTVDNGDGTPEEYGVEFGEDKADEGTPSIPGMDDAVPLPAEADPLTLDDSVTTMPAQADPLIGQPENAFGAAEPRPDQGFAPGFAEPAIADQGFAPGFTEPAIADQGFAPGFTEPAIADPGFAPGVTEPAGANAPGGAGFAPGVAEPAFTTMPAPDSGGFAPGFTEPSQAQPQFQSQPFQPQQFESPQFQPASAQFTGQFDQGFAAAASTDSGGTTTTSGASVFGGGSGGFNGADSVLGGSPSGSDSTWSSPSNTADQGLAADTNASTAGQAGSASLPSMQDAHGQSAAASPTGGMMGGGMPPMGGGMAGGGQQQGGDTERSPGQWRTTGSLFDDDVNLSRVQGVLGEEGR